jgi:4-amino-4-deoxy-L-arabinose transferase-like glycosyltransferase
MPEPSRRPGLDNGPENRESVRPMSLEEPVLAQARPTEGPDRTVLAIVLAGAAVRLALGAVVPITVDEAYYVDWARHLQLGYLDHPPLVAWLLAPSLALLGSSTFAVRLPAVLLQAGTTLFAASLARARGGRAAAVTLALLLQAVPIFSLGATLMTPDASLALAWAGALWSVERALRGDGSPGTSPRWFLAGGAFLGLAALSKLHGGLLGVALLAALLVSARGRRALASPWPWAGVLVAALVASPMLWWNASHGWPSFVFQASHGARGREFSLGRLAGSLGGQAGYVSPLVLVLAAAAAWRALRRLEDPVTAVLALSSLPVVAFFTAAAAFTPGALPHWAAPGWLSACILLAIGGTRLLRPALGIGFGLSGLLLVLVLLVSVVPLPISPNPIDELRGWSEGARAARVVAGDARLAADHWIVLGQLGFADGRSPAYVGERRSGPTFYDPAPLASGAPHLLVTVEGLDPTRAELEERLGPLTPAGGFEAKDGERVIRHYRFWWIAPRRRG